MTTDALLEQLEEDLLGLLLALQELAVKRGGLFGQACKRDQIVLGVRERRDKAAAARG